VAPDMRLATQSLRYASGAARAHPLIASCITKDADETLVIAQPETGLPVSIEALPATKGGTALRGRSLVSAGLEECAFFRGDTAVVNDVELFAAVSPRVMPGGIVILASTPWAEDGLLYDQFTKNWNHPLTALAARAATTLMNPAKAYEIAREYERDPDNAAREFGANFMTIGTSAFFNRNAIDAAIDHDLPEVRVRPKGERTIIGIGADTALTRDSSAIVVCHRVGDQYYVAECEEATPVSGAPLKLSEVCAGYAAMMGRHNMRYAYADGHSIEPSREYLEPLGCSLELAPAGQGGKFEVHDRVSKLLNEGKIHISPTQKRLIQQFRQCLAAPISGGRMRIWSPRKTGTHGDTLSAAVLAIWAASECAESVILDDINDSEQHLTGDGERWQEGLRGF